MATKIKFARRPTNLDPQVQLHAVSAIRSGTFLSSSADNNILDRLGWKACLVAYKSQAPGIDSEFSRPKSLLPVPRYTSTVYQRLPSFKYSIIQLKIILLAASIAFSASAADDTTNTTNTTDIAPAVQSRLADLELADIHTETIFSQLAAASEDATADLTVSGLRLDSALVNNVNQFNETQRDEILSGIDRVSDEPSRFYSDVASNALTYCVNTVQADNNALIESFEMVQDGYADEANYAKEGGIGRSNVDDDYNV
ncbi:uncharacterized protein BDV17DRAFT_286590 [Aspergillus undulatus]|uniref:uncharacterized protein n=1 Tax=Aspergillus undulatus TaxID=1810928 RepID=UPI003CCCA11D